MIQGSRAAGPRRAGFGSLLTAGILGGLVGAGALYGFQTWQESQQAGDAPGRQIEQQLGSFARQDAVRALEGRLAAIESAQSGLAQRVQTAQSLAEQAANRPAPAGAPAGAPNAAGPQGAAVPAEIANRLNALEAQLRERPQAAPGATPDPQALDRRFAEQEQRLTGAIQPLERRLAEVDQRIAGAVQPLERRLTEQDQRLAGAIQPLERRIGELDQRVAAATQPLERRLAEVDQRVGAVTQQVAGGGSEATRAGTRLVLSDRLGDALRTGAPFAEVLAGLRRFEPDAGKLAPLEPFAQGGAPTAEALARSFRPLGERLVRDSRQGAEDWTDRLLRMAEQVVTVRSVNDPGGTGVPATVARIEDALARGAIGDAAAAWDSLPEPARQASAEWGRLVKQRAAAEAASRNVAAEAVAALNQATR